MNRSVLKGRRVALGVGGGIAAYKACELVRELARSGAQVRVAMTEAAQKFVTALSFLSLSGNPVLTDAYGSHQEPKFGHLDLARWADMYAIVPATADLLARIRAGLANDAVTTSLLAFKGPVLLAPAMNVAMLENRITQENLKAILAEARFRSVGPNSGLLADGDRGPGRLSEVSELVDALAAIAGAGDLAGANVLVTAGPTREFIDPVRFISSPSTGKMGLALAQAARSRGAVVTVILGPTPETGDDGLEIVRVTSAEEMAQEVLSRIEAADYFLSAAAVADYRPKKQAAQKIKKLAAETSLDLVPAADVLAQASEWVTGRRGRRPLMVGFAAETENLAENAQAKLLQKNLDAIVANDVSQPDAGFAVDTNRVLFIARDGERKELSGSKREVATQLWDLLKDYSERKNRRPGAARRR